ncbi:unnamed protein product [Spodoptera littoralis]|uniref:Biogenesis of lysosome-related organelles complex 1 subunit 5 n=1 Tax=Spodoptera littoralis TaxID=7109 RepID=A0A9P0I3Y9_SPOLI|nr:unnamed protein product [Spodoptera littoralis]
MFITGKNIRTQTGNHTCCSHWLSKDSKLNDIMTELSREIGEIWSRLFDHRPFLNGEIKFMLKEFEVCIREAWRSRSRELVFYP